MGYFVQLKGPYTSLDRVDKTLHLQKTTDSSGDSCIPTVERGTILAIASDANHPDGVFKIATGSDSPIYVALMGNDDLQAGMAGLPDTPKVTGEALYEGEFETDNYTEGETYQVGDKLYVKDGVLTKSGSESDTVVGVVTMAVHTIYQDGVDAANPVAVFNQGAYGDVLRFTTTR